MQASVVSFFDALNTKGFDMDQQTLTKLVGRLTALGVNSETGLQAVPLAKWQELNLSFI
jgi:hypothetical protein